MSRIETDRRGRRCDRSCIPNARSVGGEADLVRRTPLAGCSGTGVRSAGERSFEVAGGSCRIPSSPCFVQFGRSAQRVVGRRDGDTRPEVSNSHGDGHIGWRTDSTLVSSRVPADPSDERRAERRSQVSTTGMRSAHHALSGRSLWSNSRSPPCGIVPHQCTTASIGVPRDTADSLLGWPRVHVALRASVRLGVVAVVHDRRHGAIQ
jgi:hypothetical protein